MLRYSLMALLFVLSFPLDANPLQTPPLKEIILKAPDLSEKYFLGATVGIRPYRKSGPRLEEEHFDHKTIIHNYGYGGSGLTLCWGGAQRVIELLSNAFLNNPSLLQSNRIAVLGAGVIGLSTAYELLNLGYDVTIYADEFSPNLTSDIAIGIWSPPSLKRISSSEKKQVIKRMLEVSTERYLQLATAEEPEFLGVGFIDDYSFKNQSAEKLSYFESNFHGEKNKVAVQFDNGLRKIGRVKKILTIDRQLFFKDLFNKVERLNASIVQRHLENIQDILDLEENIIVNCTSFGSEKLFNDQEFLPIRGHILFFKNVRHLDYMAYENVANETSTWITMCPRGDILTISGTFEEGIREASVDPAIVKRILEHARSRFSPKNS
ncbi:MAG: FAD-dependent oxidoreductase [Chlamydiota bacterium]